MNGTSESEPSVSLTQMSAFWHFAVRLFMGGGGGKRESALSAIDWAPGRCLLSSISGSQSVVPRTTSSASPGNLIEMAELLNLKFLR